jgi:hypothetical protein
MRKIILVMIPFLLFSCKQFEKYQYANGTYELVDVEKKWSKNKAELCTPKLSIVIPKESKSLAITHFDDTEEKTKYARAITLRKADFNFTKRTKNYRSTYYVNGGTGRIQNGFGEKRYRNHSQTFVHGWKKEGHKITFESNKEDFSRTIIESYNLDENFIKFSKGNEQGWAYHCLYKRM